MPTKEAAYQEIERLVKKFDAQIANFKQSDYNETQTRRDFIDPFFEALGWDMNNKMGAWEAYREVVHEDKLKVGGVTKAPDYSFRFVGGQRLFFVEAKRPSVVIKDDVAPAYQVRLYGWNAKLSLSVVTDFEEFAIYDCSKKPLKTDKVSKGRLHYFTYKEYLTQFDFLWDTFSKEAVIKGGLIRFQQADKKGTATVDREFLASLDEWRKLLAGAIYKFNQDIGEDALSYAVQQTIDRIIFLRIAEDRGLETYGYLKGCLLHEYHYGELFRLFRIADDKYNSGLFHFKNEKENTAPEDKITGKLHLDNKTLKTIINSLYAPQCDYLFNVLPVEILGSAYEQFLGSEIVIKGSRAVIEEKPEVRKAGGVFYTPQYIVNYIVSKTVGEKCKGKTPKEISSLKIVDPACGSGSFLLGAYQYLLDWHKEYYSKETAQKTKELLTPEGNLTTNEKKRILLNNIYGADIDKNAVEVTKLSLLLKCMEGETAASVGTQTRFFNERVLPSLEQNIKCGNSLIDHDYHDLLLFDEERDVNTFNWKQAFPAVFKAGGFDAVIGNPPYVRQEMLTAQKPYYQQHYEVYHGMADLYTYFFEKGFQILKEGGLFGVIVANKWMRANYGAALRPWLKQRRLKEIIDFGDLPVFQNATTYPCIIIYERNKPASSFAVCNVKTLDFADLTEYVSNHALQLKQKDLDDAGWNLASDAENKLLKKLQGAGIPLGTYVKGKIFRGVLTGLNEAFVIDKATRDQLIKKDKKSAELIKPFLAGRDIKRYQQPASDRYLILMEKGFTNRKGNHPKNAFSWLKNAYPAIAAYLEPFKIKAEARYDKGDYWWELRACDYYQEFERPKIMLPDIALRMQATYDIGKYYLVNTAYIIPVDDKFLLAILNSSLTQFYYLKISSAIRGGYLRFIRQYLEQIPVVFDKTKAREIIQLVDKVIQMNGDWKSDESPNRLEQHKSKLIYIYRKIDQLVYELYGLTEEEIKIVEAQNL